MGLERRFARLVNTAAMTIALAGCTDHKPIAQSLPTPRSASAAVHPTPTEMYLSRSERSGMEASMRNLASVIDHNLNRHYWKDAAFMPFFRRPELISDQDLNMLFTNPGDLNIPEYLMGINHYSSFFRQYNMGMDAWSIILSGGRDGQLANIWVRSGQRPVTTIFIDVVPEGLPEDIPHLSDLNFFLKDEFYWTNLERLAQTVYQLPEMEFRQTNSEDGSAKLIGFANSYDTATTLEVDQTGSTKLEIEQHTP